MIYQLTYELRDSEKDYTDFFTYLEKELGDDALHILRDAWWFSLDKADLDGMSDDIKKHMGDKDIFYLASITPGQINGWMPKSVWKWYNEHS